MSDLFREQEILLREYQEAGQTCRNHEQLIRTGLSIFAAVQAGIIGFIGTRQIVFSFELVLLEVLGFWLSIVVLITTLRLSHRYINYMERAKCIEKRMGMYLYQYSSDYFDMEKIPGQWLGNQNLFASIPFVAFFLYAFLLVRDGNTLAHKILLCLGIP